MAFSNQELARITGYTGQMGQGRHKQHVEALAEKVKQGDRDAFNRLNQMNQYFDQQGMGGYKYNVPSLPGMTQEKKEEGPGSPVNPGGGLLNAVDPSTLTNALRNIVSTTGMVGGTQTFDKAKLAQISGYDQTPMFRGFGGTVDTAMGKGRHGNYVFDLLAASRGGDSSAREKLEAMNRYFDSIPGYGGSKIDIDGASFSDKPVNRELRQVTGYTGLFGPDAKAAGQSNFGDYVTSLRDDGKFEELAKVNEVLEKYGYQGFEIDPGKELTDRAKRLDFAGDITDVDAIGRFLSYQGTKKNYVDEYGELTPVGKQALLAENPELPPGTQLSLDKYIASQNEFLDEEKYSSTPTQYNIAAAESTIEKTGDPVKTGAQQFDAQQVASEVAKVQVQAARQQGLTDYVEPQKGEVDVKSTVQGQLAALMQQFEGGKIPSFAAGAIRLAEQKLASRGMGASSMAGAALVQAAMEASTPIAAADAETYRRMAEANLNNRQQAEVLNAQMTLQMDMSNLSNEQQARITNTQKQIQALFTDQAAVNSARQFNAQTEQQNDQFFANLFNETAKFNSTQANAINKFNAGQQNAVAQFNSEIATQRQQFAQKNQILIDQANAVYRRQINTANTALTNAETEFNLRNLFNISQNAQAILLQEHRDELNFARLSATNDDEYLKNLAIASIQHDTNLDVAKEFGTFNLLGKIIPDTISTIYDRYSN